MLHRPRIAAFDIATATGVADGYPGEIPTLETVRFGADGDSHLKICSRALGWIAKRLTDDPPDIAYIEAPMPLGAAIHGKSNARTIVRLHSLYGIVGAAVTLKGIPLHQVEVGPVRQTFIGHAQLKGDEAKRRCKAMCKLLGWPCHTLDEGDAGALWHFACSVQAPKLAVIIHPGMHRKLATLIGGMDIKELFVHG
jgi:hypothetical protein